MTELDLYKHINSNAIEWHWMYNGEVLDVIVHLLPCEIAGFVDMIRDFNFKDGIECRLRNGYISFWMKDICDCYNIDISNVFKKP